MIEESTPEQLAWAAGFFEGEGVISKSRNSPFIAINNTDYEHLEEFYRIIGVGTLCGPYGPNNNGISKKEFWTWRVCNRKDRQNAVDKIAPWLSARRLEQLSHIVEIKT